MSEFRPAEVAELVKSALEREPAVWPAFLDEVCGADLKLRTEVESLLGFKASAQDLIEQPAVQIAAEMLAEDLPAFSCGQRVGRYEVIALIGSGGMGEVYLAQDLELGRKVALKFIKNVFGSQNLLRHFRAEERILAGLNHPNIAQLYGAETTADGTPYFVMEYVEGERLDRFCDDRELDLDARLRLFIKVCAGVSYAHQHLVIHRDLKPANIRVTPDGEPKLLDFGIAKLFDAETLDAPERTVTLAGTMTPEYASPEQVRGERMTTASDVYSLGVVLYELLTGRKPYRLTSRQPHEIARAITDQEAARPSTTVLSDNPNFKIQNPKVLRGDLDNIILKAMRKEPERRYVSVAQFSEDLRRHLDGLPISARKDTWSYRSAKFVRRHLFGVLAATVVAIAVIAGSAVSIWEAHRANVQRARAERRFNDVRRLSHSLMFEFDESVQNLSGSTATRQLVVSRALEYLNSLAQEASDDASLQEELATGYRKIGDIQGNPYSANLGDIAGAMQTYARSRAIYESLLATKSKTSDVRRDLTALYDRIGEVRLHSSDTQGALDVFQKSLALRQQLLPENPNDFALRRELAVSRMKLGEAAQKLGNLKDSLESLHQAAGIFATLTAHDPSDLKATRDVMVVSNKIGYVSFVGGDLDAALQNYRDGLRTAEILAAKDANNAVAQRDLSIACNNIGRILLKKGDAAGAEEIFQRSLAVARKLSASDSKNELARSDVAYVLVRLGGAQSTEQKYEEALASLKEALTINESLIAANPKHSYALSEIGDGYANIGDTLEKMKDLRGALENYQFAAATREKMSNADPKDAQYRQSLAESCQTIGRVGAAFAEETSDSAEKLARLTEARTWTARSLEMWRDLQTRGVLGAADAGQVAAAQKQLEACNASFTTLTE